MSLINKMLQDLDSRLEQAKGGPAGNELLEGVRPAGRQANRRRRNGLWLFMAAVVLLGGASVGYAYVSVLDGRALWVAGETKAKAKQTTVARAQPLQTKTIHEGYFTAEPLTADKAMAVVGDTGVAKQKRASAKNRPRSRKGKTETEKSPSGKKKIAKKRRPTRRTARRVTKSATKRKVKRTRRSKPVAVASARPVLADDATSQTSGKTVKLGKGIEKKTKPATPSQQAELKYRAAVTNLRQGNRQQAEQQLRAALALAPKHINAREMLVGVLIKTGRWPEAEQLLQTGVRLAPQHYRFTQLLARLVAERGEDGRAIKLLETAAVHGRKDPRYVALLATLYQRVGQHDKAIKAYGLALRLQPREGRWWLGVGISFEAKKNWQAARQAYQRAVASSGLSNNLVVYARQRLRVLAHK